MSVLVTYSSEVYVTVATTCAAYNATNVTQATQNFLKWYHDMETIHALLDDCEGNPLTKVLQLWDYIFLCC